MLKDTKNRKISLYTNPSLTLRTKQNARIISKINGSGIFLILKFSRTFFRFFGVFQNFFHLFFRDDVVIGMEAECLMK